MDTNLYAAIISGSISILVVIISQLLIKWRENHLLQKTETKKIYTEYINPLRFYLVENHNRISEILRKIDASKDKKSNNLLFINDVGEILEKDSNWFTGEGCYLTSSCYFTACLFAMIEHLRMGLPFLKLSAKDDTYLLKLLTKISIDFSSDLKIYYVIQMNIGEETYLRNDQRVLSYREFCTLLLNRDNLPWYSRLIDFYIRLGNGLNLERMYLLLKHMEELAGFLDKILSGGASINQRNLIEQENK